MVSGGNVCGLAPWVSEHADTTTARTPAAATADAAAPTRRACHSRMGPTVPVRPTALASMPLCHSEDHAVPVLPGGRAHPRRRASASWTSTSTRTRTSTRPQLEAVGNGDPPLLDELKAVARERGLWNLFLPHLSRRRARAPSSPTSTTPRCRRSSARCAFASELLNCAAPDTGNMEILNRYGSATRCKPALAGAAARGRDPLGVLDDRARRRLVRRHQHRAAHGAPTATPTCSTAGSGSRPAPAATAARC